MNDLRRELAPVTDEAWREIDDEAARTLRTSLAARKLVDFVGPLGWKESAVNLGRVRPLAQGPIEGTEARLRTVQPLVELCVPFELQRSELDSISRGTADPDLEHVIQAARKLAMAEDRMVFYGFHEAGVDGICSGCAHEPLPQGGDYNDFPRAMLEGMEVLREAGIAGPYALALGPESYNGLATTVGNGGYPVINHIRRLLEGPIVWAPPLEGALLLSLRGGDFQLVVGRDISIGYLDHDRTAVRLYLEESLTFRLLTPEAAVALNERA